MSTAQIGLSLAKMIRQNQVHAISCTGANLEEDVYNLIGRGDYLHIPDYKDLGKKDEEKLFLNGYRRVTDTGIPEIQIAEKISEPFLEQVHALEKEKKSVFPHEIFYHLLLSGKLKHLYQIDPKNSWLLAAAEKNLPLFVPGWEDSTTANMFVAEHMKRNVENLDSLRSGLYYMKSLIAWYTERSQNRSIGFFQIGGGIAGDFPVCVVPLINCDLGKDSETVPLWSYYCQISDSTTSYGSYSGAVPNEKISWGKLDLKSESFLVESDATIVAPLIFSYVLNE